MNRSVFILVLPVLLLVSSLPAEPSRIPSYYPQSDFLARTPGSAGDASGAFFNPAVWGMMKGPELQFFWNDLEDDLLPCVNNGLSNWALMIGGEGIGFSVHHWYYGYADHPSKFSLTDYQIALAGGNDASSIGIAYTWSRGDLKTGMERDDLLSIGTLNRHCRHFSTGLVGHYALNHKDLRGVLDVGIRPFGTPLLTVFGDAAMDQGDRYEDIKWAVGASIEPLPGITLMGKAFYGGAYMGGLSFSLGGLALSALPHFNKDNDQTHNTYGVRIGFPKPNLISRRVMKKKLYLNMTFNDEVKYQRYKYFDRKGHTLTELLEILETARKDPRIGGLAIKITEDMYGSPEVIWEVREKIKELKGDGKKVIVFLERGGMFEYYLASVADRIMVDPECSVDILGFNFGKTYYKNLLEKIGVGFDELRFFKYKTAVESFSRTDMSEGDREQLGSLAEGFYDIYRADICESRGMSHEEFDHIVNEVGFLSADSLLSYNLSDTTGRWDDMDDYIKSVEGSCKKRIGRKGLAALQPQFDDWGIKPRVAVIYGLGPCAMNYGLNANRLGPVIKRAREDKHIKAIVFRADSPGGDLLPSDIVATELKKTAEKKPVIVSQGMVAGSGGYWISMYGDKILASPWTITGSIGVIGGWIYEDGLNDKIGLSYDYVQKGDHADMIRGAYIPYIGSIPHRPLHPEERDRFEKMIRLYYKDFLGKVAEGRGMSEDEVHEVAQGRVWTGTDGLKKGLVDEIGGLDKAIKMAREAAGIKPDREIDIVEMPHKGIFKLDMFQPKLLGIRLSIDGGQENNPQLDYIRLLLQAEGRPLVMMPPHVYMFAY